MTEFNAERAVVEILREICMERGITFKAFSSDWVFCLQTATRTAYVFGYDFDLNSAAAKMIAKDKAATSDLLQHFGVPRVEHRLFHGPQLVGYVPMAGNWVAMLDYFEACARDVVCKPNEGTGGRGVFRARSPLELELAVHRLFGTSRSISISPFEEFESEFRVAVLNEKVEFVYEKQRPQVIGDGRRNIQQLALDRVTQSVDLAREIELMAGLAESKLDLTRIPAHGEIVAINWRHNLAQGARPMLLELRSGDAREITDLALRALKATGVVLASVDIVKGGGKLKVLEINSGIMMESFVRILPDGRKIAKRFYEKIVCAMLGLEP